MVLQRGGSSDKTHPLLTVHSQVTATNGSLFHFVELDLGAVKRYASMVNVFLFQLVLNTPRTPFNVPLCLQSNGCGNARDTQ